jgi:hypothetical protein
MQQRGEVNWAAAVADSPARSAPQVST